MSNRRHSPSAPLRLLAIALASGAMAAPWPATAQREIVQPLPPAAAGDLNAALRVLSRNPADVAALIQAGQASLALNDIGAADGFFVRAQAAAPMNATARSGLAQVRLAQQQPIEALRLFDEAERAGASAQSMAAARGFAYDLVGDSARAQQNYRLALATRDDAETRRRLALSLAIAGQRQAFEDTLYPLLKDNDRAAFRTRAFGLAILGQENEAMVIAETMLPTDLALRMAPYLRYMARLTAAQQAAAANLGVFPRASEIGRDDAAIAAYASQGQRIARNADNALTPSGQALGSQRNPPVTERQRSRGERRRRPDRDTVAQATSATAQLAAQTPATQTPAAPVVAANTPTPSPTPAATQSVASASPSSVPSVDVRREPVVVASAPAPAPTPAATPAPSIATVELPASQPARETGRALASLAQPAPASTASQQTATVILPEPEPAASAVTIASVAVPASDLASAPVPAPAPASQDEPVSVADAFADLGALASTSVAPGAGAVDITAIAPPREVAKADPPKPAPAAKPAPPPKPVHPSRLWVQVATGKDTAALKFDWRRIARKAEGKLDGKGPFVTKWGEANRLLAGPYDNAKQAREKMNELKALGLDSFTFTSDAGQEIKPLG